jgi:hypothetical protein
MYRSLNQILKGVATVVMAALTLTQTAAAQRSAGPKSTGSGQQPAATAEKPATTAAKPAAKAPAQQKRANKWVFGAHTIAAPGVSITGPDFQEWPVSTTMGGGLGVMAGYEINRAVTAFGSLDVARQNSGVNWMEGSFGLVHFELGVRAKLSQTNPQMTPYALAAVGRRALGSRIYDFDENESYDLSFSGMMLSFGGGLEYRLSPKVSMDGGLELGIGTLNQVNSDGDVGTVSANTSTSIRVRAGVVWRP